MPKRRCFLGTGKQRFGALEPSNRMLDFLKQNGGTMGETCPAVELNADHESELRFEIRAREGFHQL